MAWMSPNPERNNPSRSSPKRVLVIDDTPEILDVISDCLSHQGLETVTAQDGATGIRLAQEHPPDLIICDVNMPGADGYSVLLALRQMEATATVPFIFLTGVSDKIHVRRGMELGADDYLTKPFTQKELKAAVTARLDKQAELQRQTDRRLDELRGSLTLALPHELRTPLNGILGLSAILMDESAQCTPDEVLSTARDINTSAERLHHLIENFLLYSQIQLLVTEKKSLINASYLPIAGQDVIPEIAASIARKHRREGDLELDIHPALFHMPGENLRKIIEETLDNAFKFSERGKKVVVRTESGTNPIHSQLVVMDQGRGMTEEQISKVGPHTQFGRNQYEQQGAGLGLVIAKRMTELLGGTYTIQSQISKGTTIIIRFIQRDPSNDTAYMRRAQIDSSSAEKYI